MPDKVKPLKLENPSTGGTETNLFPTEADPAEDYLAAAGVAFKNSDDILVYGDANNEVAFKDVVSGDHKLKTLKCFDLAIWQDLNPYLDRSSNTFSVVARFIFQGTNRLATPSSVNIIMFGSTASSEPEFRLYDLTNNQIIATQTGAIGTAIQLYSFSGTNWPANQAILELQLRKVSGTGQARLGGFNLLW